METKYLCSHCENAINVGNDIVLSAKNKDGEKGLVFLHTDLGNYESKFSAEFKIREGEKVKFYCPICHHNLTNLKNEKLAYFTMVDENEKEFTIVFSNIFGEHCSYKVEEKEVVKSFGYHWAMYSNPEWFLYK